MARTLTKKQKGFVKDYIETGNGSLSVRNNYDVTTDAAARAIASENLTKPNVRAYLESKAERASEIIFDLAENGEMDQVRLSAAKDILDRTGYKPTEKTLNVNVDVKAEPSDRIKQIAREIKDNAIRHSDR